MRYLFYRIIAAISLITLLPLFAVLYLLVKLTFPGPFIFKQKRVGERGKIFTMYKIRTMVQNAENLKQNYQHLNEAAPPVFKIRNDPRYTKVGKLLAHAALDELPQLVNILKGELSFVGPRPLPVSETACIPEKHHSRFDVKPGITSSWVVGRQHKVSFNRWMEMDISYVNNNSLLANLQIILQTLLLCGKLILKR